MYIYTLCGFMMDGENEIIIQHSGAPKGDKESDGNCKVLPQRAGGWGVRNKEGDDCMRVNRLNDGRIATMI